jgi:hypothetical protein
MPGPMKAIKGGIQGVKNGAMAVKVNNRMAKNPDLNIAAGGGVTKKAVTPKSIVKAFVNGAKNPDMASARKDQLKSMNTAQKKRLGK